MTIDLHFDQLLFLGLFGKFYGKSIFLIAQGVAEIGIAYRFQRIVDILVGCAVLAKIVDRIRISRRSNGAILILKILYRGFSHINDFFFKIAVYRRSVQSVLRKILQLGNIRFRD